MRRALLIMVHGSPDESANEPIYRVADRVVSRGVYPIVAVGFLECNRPTIQESIDSCVLQGAERIDAVPYFLHTGKHVADDLPTLMGEARDRYPEIEFRLADYLGRSPRITDILGRRAVDAKRC